MKQERKEGRQRSKEIEVSGRKDRRGGKDRRQKRPPEHAVTAALGYIDGMTDREESMRMMDDSEWAVTWGDLMMTMFVLFAMMFIYMQSERNVIEAFRYSDGGTGGTGSGVTEGDGSSLQELPPGFSADDSAEESGLSPEKILQLAEDAVNSTDLEDVQVLLQDDKTIKISLRGPLLFDLGSAELRDNTKSFLAKVALVIRKTDNEVHVAGHTDTFPMHSDLFPTNWELSVVRASAVARYLIQAAQLEPGRFTVMGYSMYRPALPNATLQNKQMNRRVEIIITKKIYKHIPLE